MSAEKKPKKADIKLRQAADKSHKEKSLIQNISVMN